MPEYFIRASSFAAPFFSDDSEACQEAETAMAALEAFAAHYDHPAGLYAASAYENADAYHKQQKPLARWLCNHEIVKAQRTKALRVYSYFGHAPGDFEINGERITVPDPKSGRVVEP